MKSRAMPCNRDCGTDIYFDDDKLSKTGKKIPLDVDTDEPHDCPNSSYGSTVGTSSTKSLTQRLEELESRVAMLEERSL